MIREKDGVFYLETDHTLYMFRVHENRHLEHLYYGAYFDTTDISPDIWTERPVNPPGCSVIYRQDRPAESMDHMLLEVSTEGIGDLRTPMICLTFGDGSRTADFIYDSYEIIQEAVTISGLPSAYTEGKAQTLVITLKESSRPIILKLFYIVMENSNTILRHCELINNGDETITVRRLGSLQLDLAEPNWEFTGLQGEWTREMQPVTLPICATELLHKSSGGFSSNRASSLVFLKEHGAMESSGAVIGCNLIYSGAHQERVQMSSQGYIRLVTGMEDFIWKLEKDNTICSPQAVLTYGCDGFERVSHEFHDFVREHIVRGPWKKKPRPVLANSWEACYFQIKEASILRLAKAAKELGVELFVLDDGWFKNRDDDQSSLGDWYADLKKLPGGLKQIGDKIRDLGMEFGIWIEPEMISRNSDLYRAHPDWAVKIPYRVHSEGRNQMLLDLTQEAVQQYMIQSMTRVFEESKVTYVKWDMNRHFSDMFSQNLSVDDQGGFGHRYILGLYNVLDTLTKRFPDILFEACASGGNRFDLGMLCYMQQIWTSDNTDAISRAYIQNGCSYGYPTSVMGAHISSCPNHQTLRSTPLETRFAVSAFGLLGYEMDLTALSVKEKKEIREQISLYKKWREVFQFGTFSRIGGRLNTVTATADGLGPWSRQQGDLVQWAVISPQKDQAVIITVQEMVQPNMLHGRLRMRGLKKHTRYRIYNLKQSFDIRRFGDLINTVSPLHIKQNSLLHHTVAQVISMDSEVQEMIVTGDMMEKAGVALAPCYTGTGYENGTRLYQDFETRIYFIEELPIHQTLSEK